MLNSIKATPPSWGTAPTRHVKQRQPCCFGHDTVHLTRGSEEPHTTWNCNVEAIFIDTSAKNSSNDVIWEEVSNSNYHASAVNVQAVIIHHEALSPGCDPGEG